MTIKKEAFRLSKYEKEIEANIENFTPLSKEEKEELFNFIQARIIAPKKRSSKKKESKVK